MSLNIKMTFKLRKREEKKKFARINVNLSKDCLTSFLSFYNFFFLFG